MVSTADLRQYLNAVQRALKTGRAPDGRELTEHEATELRRRRELVRDTLELPRELWPSWLESVPVELQTEQR